MTAMSEAAAATPESFAPTAGKRWYVVHAYSGTEKAVERNLRERVDSHALKGTFGRLLVPVARRRDSDVWGGGSGQVVALGSSCLSLGSDTVGTVRQPSSFRGYTGVTPTFGRVSRYGLTAFASSLDHIGPFSRTVRDSARLLQVMAHDRGASVRARNAAAACGCVDCGFCCHDRHAVAPGLVRRRSRALRRRSGFRRCAPARSSKGYFGRSTSRSRPSICCRPACVW